MKKLLLFMGAVLTVNLANADVFIKNETPYDVKLTYTFDKSIADRGHPIEAVVKPHAEGKAVGDGLLTKTSYKINANIDTQYSDAKDWPVVYSQGIERDREGKWVVKEGEVSDGWNRKITIYTLTDQEGNEKFGIINNIW